MNPLELQNEEEASLPCIWLWAYVPLKFCDLEIQFSWISMVVRNKRKKACVQYEDKGQTGFPFKTAYSKDYIVSVKERTRMKATLN